MENYEFMTKANKIARGNSVTITWDDKKKEHFNECKKWKFII